MSTDNILSKDELSELRQRSDFKAVITLLTNYGFYRIHQSFLINLRYVKEYIKGEGGEVIMINEDRLDVSRRRKGQFIARFLGR